MSIPVNKNEDSFKSKFTTRSLCRPRLVSELQLSCLILSFESTALTCPSMAGD